MIGLLELLLLAVLLDLANTGLELILFSLGAALGIEDWCGILGSGFQGDHGCQSFQEVSLEVARDLSQHLKRAPGRDCVVYLTALRPSCRIQRPNLRGQGSGTGSVDHVAGVLVAPVRDVGEVGPQQLEVVL